ncbi:transposon Ty3-I Gag-Pol polyprotein [Trichonephila clavipes]|nr:transposon Ty3-I Gag-Pol polyprotein [Trichonephila clavipes]
MVSETTWYKNVSLDVNNKCFDVNFKLDTGAEVDILPLYILSMFKVNPKLSKTNICLTTYGNFNLKPNGSLVVICSTDKHKNVPLPFYVVNVKSKPILGLRGCKELKLVERINAIECSPSKNELIKQYKDVFTGVEEFQNEPYHITLKDDIISRERERERLEGKKIFSVVDFKDGFRHVPFDEINSEICTFNTPFGRYKFNKMPFGIVSAPEVFQKRNQKFFGDIEGVEIYFDDIIVAGCDEDSHDAIMSRVLERAKLLNRKLIQINYNLGCLR